MSLVVSMDYQYHNLRFERFKSPKLGLLPEFLPSLLSQVQLILYEEESFQRNLVSTVV